MIKSLVFQKYYTLITIDFSKSRGYGFKTPDTSTLLKEAKRFFCNEFGELFSKDSAEDEISKKEHQYIQQNLYIISLDSTRSMEDRVNALLCLRCYVSHIILNTGKNIVDRYKEVHLSDLLGCILQDDGKAQYIIEENKNTKEIKIKKINNNNGNLTCEADFQRLPFSLQILLQYNHKSSNSNLKSFTELLTRQNEELNKTLNICGIIVRSE